MPGFQQQPSNSPENGSALPIDGRMLSGSDVMGLTRQFNKAPGIAMQHVAFRSMRNDSKGPATGAAIVRPVSVYFKPRWLARLTPWR